MSRNIGNLEKLETSISVMQLDNYMPSQMIWLLTFQQISKLQTLDEFGRWSLIVQLYIWTNLCPLLSYLRHILHKYANEDVSLGSWIIGLDVEHIDDRRLCCGTPPGKVFPNSFSLTIVQVWCLFLEVRKKKEFVHGRQISVRSNLVTY